MDDSPFMNLSRRERQIMNIIFKLGEAGVAEVLNHLSDPPGYNSIRVLLTILEDKGHLEHRKEGHRYIYYPVEHADSTKRSALRHLLSTFFEGSPSQALSTLLDISSAKLSPAELDELTQLIEKAKKGKMK